MRFKEVTLLRLILRNLTPLQVMVFTDCMTSDGPKYSTGRNLTIQINYKIQLFIIFIWLMQNNVAVTPLITN